MHFTNAIIVTCFSESSDMSSHFIAVVDAKVNIILIHNPKTILVVCSLLPNTISILLRIQCVISKLQSSLAFSTMVIDGRVLEHK
jgi:hypothetical protein